MPFIFREKNADGDLVGGPMYYIKNGLGKRWMWLAYLFAAFGVLTVFELETQHRLTQSPLLLIQLL